MALLFLDSFDHYTSIFAGGIEQKYTGGSGNIETGRHGNGAKGNFYMALPGIASATSIIGGAVNFWGGFGGDNIFSLGEIHGTYFTIDALADGRIRTSVGDRQTAPAVLRAATWHYVEMQTTVSSVPDPPDHLISIDSCKVWVDGLLVLDETDLGESVAQVYGDSLYGWGIVTFGGLTNGVIFDDVYVCDGAGAAPWNAPLGDVRIDVIRPNGAGAATAWTPTGAASNWDAVNDSTPDGDTTRVSAATASLDDLYTMEDISTSDSVIGAQLLVNASRTEEGFAGLAPLLRHSGTTTALAVRNLSSDYVYLHRNVFVTMPNGDPLTDANVNALQAGMRRTV